jgi:hypothetical protein
MTNETKLFLGELRLAGYEVVHMELDILADRWHYYVEGAPVRLHFAKLDGRYNVFFVPLPLHEDPHLTDEWFDSFEDMSAYVCERLRDAERPPDLPG